jgi:hypothetical protein
MALVWTYGARGEVGIVRMAGYLGAGGVGRFEEAIGWVISQRPGVVLLDATGLRWGVEGRGAIGSAAARLVAAGIPAHACLAPGLAVPDLAAGTLSLHPDFAAALAALESAGQPG